MPELTAEQLTAFDAAFAPLCDAFALALSENINQAVLFERPAVSQQPVSAVLESQAPVLQTTFSFPSISSDEVLLAFTQEDALALADLLAGGDGKEPAGSLGDEQIEQLADSMRGTVQGLAIALGNARNASVQPGACSTALEMLTLPPAFATSFTAVEVSLPYQIMDERDGVLRLFFTQDMVRALAPVAELAAPAPAARESNGSTVAAHAHAGNPDNGGAFRPLDPQPSPADYLPRGIELIMDIPLDVTVELGRKQMLIKDVLDLSAGSIVELERVAGEPVDLIVNGRLIAKGEVVVIDDNFGLRITEIISPADRLNGLNKKG